MRSLLPRLLIALCLAGCGVPAARTSAAGRPPDPPAVASPPLTVGADSVRVLIRGEAAFPVIVQLLDAARSSVHLEMYELGRRELVDALLRAHRRGVAVTVVDDPSVDVTVASAGVLRAAGVDVVDYPVRPGMIDHVKLLVVDDSLAVVGGINWGEPSWRHHDVDLEVRGPAVTSLEAVFERDLVTSGRRATVPVPPRDPGIVVATTLPGPDIRPLALRLIDGARRTLDLELYVITDRGIVHAIEAAAARGVRVRVLLDPDQRPSDPYAAEMAAAGVPVRLFAALPGQKLHAKVGIADGRTVLLGSANWTNSGFGHNHECDVFLPDAAQVAAVIIGALDADWAMSA